MSLNTCERQVAETLDGIRADHVERYRFASRVASFSEVVLDAPCGVGYGTAILAAGGPRRVIGIDNCAEAIAFANAHYSRPNIQYITAEIPELEITPAVDVAVCLEGIEHITDGGAVVRWLHQSLRRNGWLIASVPNEEIWPHTGANPYHHQHYTPAQFETLLQNAGFDICERFMQVSLWDYAIQPGWDGRTLIAVCRKV